MALLEFIYVFGFIWFDKNVTICRFLRVMGLYVLAESQGGVSSFTLVAINMHIIIHFRPAVIPTRQKTIPKLPLGYITFICIFEI